MFAAKCDEIIIGDGFGPNESTLEIAMNDTCGLRRRGPFPDRPGARFLGANCEVGLQMQQCVACADQPVEARFLQPHFFQKHLRFVGFQLADLFLDPGRNHDVRIALRCGHFGDTRGLAVAGAGAVFFDIADIKHRFGGQQLQHLPRLRVLSIHCDRARGLAVFQRRLRGLQQAHLLNRVLIATAHLPHEVLHAFLDALKISEHQFGFDDLGVLDGINAAFDMGDVVIFKATQHMGDGIAFADIGQKLVAEALALTGPFHETRNINECHPRRDNLFGRRNRRQFIKTRIRHSHIADIGFNRAKREIGRLRCCGSGQRVKQG